MSGANNNSAFVIRCARKTFGPTEALNIRGIDGREIHIPRGRTTVVLGRSGSGKSTLLSILGLLEEPDRDCGARITYYQPSTDGNGDTPVDLTDLSQTQRQELCRDEFATVLQDGHLIGHITVRENVGLGMILPGGHPEEVKRVASELVDGLGLKERELARPKELSGGEYQRVAVARAIAHGPRVVFADEPTGNLDVDTGEQVMARLHSWRRQRPDENTLVLVSHDLHQAWECADHFVIMQDHDVKCALSREDLKAPGPAPWRTAHDVPENHTGLDALHRVLHTLRSGSSHSGDIPAWNRRTAWWARPLNLMWYAFRDLFPLKLKPFNMSVFLTTLRDTVFSVLTLISFAVLVGVILLGLGVYAGVQRYVGMKQQHDVRANRLIATVSPGSAMPTIDAASLAALREELAPLTCRPPLRDRVLQAVLPGWEPASATDPAVEGSIHGAAEAQLFVYTNAAGSGVTALGTTVDADSQLHGRLTHRGEPLTAPLITDNEAEGIIAKEAWLRRILEPGPDDMFPPATITIDYGPQGRGSTREELPVLGVVDDLPDGSFLIAPGCWHKIRDGNWRSCWRLAYLVPPAGTDRKELAAAIGRRAADREIALTVEPYTDARRGPCLQLQSGHAGGWRRQYWRDVIWPNIARPFLPESAHATTGEAMFTLASPAAGARAVDSPMDYWAAIIYLRELGAALDVAKTVEEGNTGWTIDPYVVDLCILMDRTRQLSMLFSFVVGGCTLVLCTLNIFLLFYQTVLRKRHALGILKGFGSPRHQLVGLFVLESLYLAIGGALLGLLVAWCAGRLWVGQMLKGIFDVQWDQPLFALTANTAATVLGACIVLCVLITCLATFRTAGKTANQLLRQRE